VGAGRGWPGLGRGGLGRVIGITPSQSARNTLAAGVPESYNCAQFLGHLPGQRGARGPVQLHPGDVVLVDEASMVANPDLADVISQAADSGAKVILAGDTQQLQAVEASGGLSLLANAVGFVQLAEPVRFRAEWEQAASLRLRAGDTSVLALDADPATGQRRWTDRTFLYQHFSDAELGYAVTDHVAQRRTVTAGWP
jgi:ATP-dependent exoDNAse (exonuclease V) alpha subunit